MPGFYLPPPPRNMAPPLRITALETRTLTSYTVIFQPLKGGLTEVVVGEARLKERKAAAPPMVPVYPGGKDVLQSSFEGARTLGYQVEAKDAEVKAWYQKELTRIGYKEEEPLVFRREGQEVRLDVTPQGSAVHVFLFLAEARRAPADVTGARRWISRGSTPPGAGRCPREAERHVEVLHRLPGHALHQVVQRDHHRHGAALAWPRRCRRSCCPPPRPAAACPPPRAPMGELA